MLRDIINKEMLDTISSPKFVFTFLLCTILILLSVYTGINSYRAELGEYNASIALNRKNLESQPSYGALAGLGVKVTKPPQVLSTIVSGIQEAVGRKASVNVAYDPSLVDSKYDSNPVFAVFGELDLSFIVKIVLSLLAILFTFDAVVGEKERGTLKLTLSNNVPRDRFILGKAIGSFASLLLPLIIPMVLGLIILTVYPDISLTGEDWLRIGIIFILFLLYISVFFMLGLFVSARTSRSSTSLLVLLFIWVTFVTVIPRAAVMAAGQIYPIPSVHEITAQKDAFLQEIQGLAPQKLNEWRQENPPQDTQEYQDKFKKFLEELQQDLTSKIDKKNAAIEEEYQAKRRKQEALATNLSRISPTSTLMFGAMSLGRTGIHEHERFLNSIKTYKPVFTKWVNAKMMRTLKLGSVEQPRPDISDMPVHQFEPESLNQSLAAALPDFAIMILLIILFFTGAFVSFLRYDVR
ncbi:MAG TPA: ABC transporter permease subunit [archaeon]|nr:ABC transporter permease subunit [archaeon]